MTKAFEHRAEIAKAYLKGRVQSEIAKELGVTQACISRNLKAIRREWLKSSLVNFNEAVAKELAKVDNLERVYWEGWERSQKEALTRSSKIANGTIERTRKLEEKVGNPQFLQGVQWCIDKRCKLLDLDAPDRLQINWEDTLPEGVTPNEVTQQFGELMRLAANATDKS